MENLNDILFTQGDYQDKYAEINRISTDELLSISENTIKEIVSRCAGESQTLWIEKRVGNDWNSLIENVSVNNGKLYVSIYVQGAKTDTSQSERFSTFFQSGEYVSNNNRLWETIRYNERQKAEAMRSILLECIYRLHNDEAKRRQLVAKLSHYTIINPVKNHFYRKLDLWHNQLSKYSSRGSVVKNNGYHHAEKQLQDYIDKNAYNLLGKTTEELQKIYTNVFQDAYDEFDKNFDFDKMFSACS